jgi:hypothetical protein
MKPSGLEYRIRKCGQDSIPVPGLNFIHRAEPAPAASKRSPNRRKKGKPEETGFRLNKY